MISFNVLIFEFNQNIPTVYDIMPYLVSQYESISKLDRPKLDNFEMCKIFILDKLKYQYWARCEYEFIMVHWPYNEDNVLKNSYKIDVYEQCKMNINIITKIFIENIKKGK